MHNLHELRMGINYRIATSLSAILLFLSTPGTCGELVVHSVSVRGTRTGVKLETQPGRIFDMQAVDRDVKRLWNTGALSDVRVQRTDVPEGADLVFEVTENPRLQLHELRIEPTGYDVKLKLPAGTPISSFRAHQIALQAENQLVGEGYAGTQVDSELCFVRRPSPGCMLSAGELLLAWSLLPA